MKLKHWVAGAAGSFALVAIAMSAEAAPLANTVDGVKAAGEQSPIEQVRRRRHRHWHYGYGYAPFYFSYGPRYGYYDRYHYYRPYRRHYRRDYWW
jgi:hypothetical protein